MRKIYSLLYTACGGDITPEWVQAVTRVAKRQWRSSFSEFRKAFLRLLREHFAIISPNEATKIPQK